MWFAFVAYQTSLFSAKLKKEGGSFIEYYHLLYDTMIAHLLRT